MVGREILTILKLEITIFTEIKNAYFHRLIQNEKAEY